MLHVCSQARPRLSGLASSAGSRALLVPYVARHVPTQYHALGPRALAARASPEDKSWGEILQDAAVVAKSVGNKIKDGVSQALAPLVKASESKPAPKQQEYQDQRIQPAPEQNLGLFPTLLGKAVGGLVSSMAQGLAKQLQEVAKEQQGVLAEATARLHSSARLRDRLGTVSVGPPVQQSSSSMSINGVTTKQVVLVLPVRGSAGGYGEAQVRCSDSGAKGREMGIEVVLSDGSRVSVESGSSGSSSGRVIDVEYREIK